MTVRTKPGTPPLEIDGEPEQQPAPLSDSTWEGLDDEPEQGEGPELDGSGPSGVPEHGAPLQAGEGAGVPLPPASARG
jgi:hypothetical protein